MRDEQEIGWRLRREADDGARDGPVFQMETSLRDPENSGIQPK